MYGAHAPIENRYELKHQVANHSKRLQSASLAHMGKTQVIKYYYQKYNLVANMVWVHLVNGSREARNDLTLALVEA
jgi:hypothetical protein